MTNVPLLAILFAALAVSVSATIDPISNATTSRRLAKVSYNALNLALSGHDIGRAKALRAEDCLAKCKAVHVPGCLVFTWTRYEGGTCFFKTGWEDPKIYMGAVSGVLLEEAIGGTARAYSASFSNCDMPGFDIGQIRGTVESCDRTCWAHPACKAVTWTKYNGGTCFFKSNTRQCAPVAGATTVVVFNQLVKA